MTFGWLKPNWLLERKAAQLLARMEFDPSPANKQALERWRDADPRHAKILRSSARVLRESVNLSGSQWAATRAEHEQQARTPRSSNTAWVASIALALVGLSTLYLAMRPGALGQPVVAIMLTTGVGESREFPLSDGTKVVLDPATAVRVEIDRSHRLALVERGRARFAVPRRNMPLLIRGQSLAVRINEGLIEVRTTPTEGIDLLQGTAQVTSSAAPQPFTVHAPATMDGKGIENPPVVQTSAADETTGRLNFDRTRLRDVVAAANRRTTTQIVIRDPAVADLRVTGVFRVDDAERLATALASAFGLRLARDGQDRLLLMSSSEQH